MLWPSIREAPYITYVTKAQDHAPIVLQGRNNLQSTKHSEQLGSCQENKAAAPTDIKHSSPDNKKALPETTNSVNTMSLNSRMDD